MTSSHVSFGSLMATTSDCAQSSPPSSATAGTWSVGVEGGKRGDKRGKGEHGRSAWSGGPPAAQPGQSQSPNSPSRSAWARGPPAAKTGQSQPPPAFDYQGASVSWSAGTDGGHGYSAWSCGPPTAQSGQSQSPPASASQGAGQDKAKGKGKGKGKKKRHKKSNSTGQSQADNLHNKAQGLKIEDGIEESNEEVCFICAEPVKYYSVSTCNHRTCHVCALRLKALYKKLECTFCKEPQLSVVFTASPDKRYEEYDLGRIPHRDNELSIFFEKQEMMEETLVLLRFNCPDPDCDYIGKWWGDVRLHTKTAHNRLICDLCIRNKRVFAHEHILYTPSLLSFHLPSMVQRYRQLAPKDKIEGGVHPMCEFCHECFFGDDELYAHLRERHEECFVCKRNDIRNQYFQDYDSLEEHFYAAHHPCTQPQCLARKFIVFDTVLDLKAHTVEEHSGDMSPRDRKDARRFVPDFTFDDRHDYEPHYQYGRYQELEREREPPPMIRRFQATGQNRRRESFGMGLTIDDATTIGESSIWASQRAFDSNRTLSPREDVDPAVTDALVWRLHSLASNPTTAIPAADAAIRRYRSSESSARDFISTIWNILDRNLVHAASIVNAFVDLFEEEEKKQDLLTSWKGFVIEQRRQPSQPVPTSVGGSYAAIATRRVLNAEHSTIAQSSQKSPRVVSDSAQAMSSSMSTQPSSPVPPTKISWASLLKSSSSTTPGPSVPSGRNMLPTLNMAGISISASAMASSSSSASAGVSPRNKTELVALLTNGTSSIGNYATALPGAATNGRPVQKGKLKLRGLVNSGNMCFANSVLQMLVYTVPFQTLFFEIGKLKGTGMGLGKEAKDSSASTTPLVDAMVEFVKEFVVADESDVGSENMTNVTASGWGKGKKKESERENGDEDEWWESVHESELWESGDEDELWGTEPFLPGYVYEAMKGKKRFDNMLQEDAEEFLGFLLETLEDELVLLKETLTSSSPSSGWQEIGKKRAVEMRTIKSTESPITKIFGGKFRTTLRVPHKKKNSVIVEDWRSIRLDIQRDQIHTVQDALAYISQPQPVQVTNPARPGTTLEAHQVVHIDALPPVLVLHMKRFCYDTSVGGVVKVGKQVTFEPELEIGKEVLSHAIRKSQQPKYKLFGVLYHHGLSAFGGFYTLDVLHPTRFSSSGGSRPREGWIRFYDEMVSDVRHEDVFGGERDDDRCAYLLFYRRIQ